MLRLIAVLTIGACVVYFALQRTHEEIFRDAAKPIPGWKEQYRGTPLQEYLLQRGELNNVAEDSINVGR